MSQLKQDIRTFLPKELKEYPGLEQYLETLERSINKKGKKNAFKNIDFSQKEDVDFNILVQEIVLQLKVPNNIRIKTRGTLPNLNLNKEGIVILFRNLFVNAIAAIENSTVGLITVEAREQEKNWMFCIADNGKGMPKQIQAVIFELFNSDNKGPTVLESGLGSVKHIIDQYNGDIWLSSEDGVGTTVYFTLQTT